MDKDLPKEKFNTSAKRVSFPELYNKKIKSKGEVPVHNYFNAHQCHLPPDKLNAFEIKCSSIRKSLLKLTTVHTGDVRAVNLYRSYAALCAEKYRQYKYYPLSIHPFSKLRVWVEAFMLLAMMASNTAIAVHFSDPDPADKHDGHQQLMSALDLIYLMNIILNFFTGYVEGNTCQYVVLDLKMIACKYARSWLAMDVLSSLCFVPGIVNMDNIYPLLLLLSVKLLRLPILFMYLDNLLTVSRAGLLKKTLVETVVLIISYLTWNIFFQFAVEYMREGSFNPLIPNNCSWITMAQIWNSSNPVRLSFTLDRAVGMLRNNANINLIEKDGCFETFNVIAWIVAKLLVYHCALKYIVSLFGRESAQANYFIMTKQVETLMNQKKFPPRIKKKILKFYSIRFQSNYFAEYKMLACVTGQLREDILMHTGRQLVRKLEFLEQLPRALLLQLGLKLKIVIFIAGDIIFKINTVGDCLYFIDKGTVAIYSESAKEICHLENGDYFGEIAMVTKHSIRTASAVAVTNCELFRLDKADFDGTIACYPTVYENIKKVAIDRYERTCVLDEHHKAELSMKEEHTKP